MSRKLKLSGKQMVTALTDAYQRGYNAGYARCEKDWQDAAEEIRSQVQSAAFPSPVPAGFGQDDDEEDELCADDEDAGDDEATSEDKPPLVEDFWEKDSWTLYPHDAVNSPLRLKIKDGTPHREAILEVIGVIEASGGFPRSVSHRAIGDEYSFTWDMPAVQPHSLYGHGVLNPQGVYFSARGSLASCLVQVAHKINVYKNQLPPQGRYTHVRSNGINYRYTHDHDGRITLREREIAPYVYERV